VENPLPLHGREYHEEMAAENAGAGTPVFGEYRSPVEIRKARTAERAREKAASMDVELFRRLKAADPAQPNSFLLEMSTPFDTEAY
jgi:hypothetical protein